MLKPVASREENVAGPDDLAPPHPDDPQMEHGSRTTCHHAERRAGSQPFPHTTAGEVERLFVGRHFRLFPRDGFCSRSQDGLLALHGQQLCL